MNTSLLSNSWYRVANLKPRLRSHACVHRHRYRGEVWYLLQNPVTGQIQRLTPAARTVIAALNGKRSVEEVWAWTTRRLREDAPTQDEVIYLLGQLHATDLLQCDVTPDIAELFARGEQELKARRQRSFANPMALRFSLWDPDALLNRFQSLIDFIWSRWGGLLWVATVLPALLILPLHWPELTNNFSDRVLAVDNIVILYLVFPVIKLLHELGHATATKAGGGEVHDMGIVLLVLMPVPYVEASAATTFRSKYQRAMVGAAGMAAELFLAALAFYGWLMVEHGLTRAVLFNVMMIASVSTLIFNGNPLLRYDAYYILADLVEIPNLAKRSLSYCFFLIERYVLGVGDGESLVKSRAERGWFVCYGVASSIYRIFVTLIIASFIASRFFLIGILLAGWALVAMAVLPLVRGIKYLLNSPRLHNRRSRALAVTVGSFLALVVFLAMVPVPYHTDAEGVVWLPEEAMVRAGANGFVDRLLVDSGTLVAQGDPLVRSFAPALQGNLHLAQARVEELDAEYGADLVADKAKADITRKKLQTEKAALALASEQAADLIVNARRSGVFVSPQAADMPGRYFRKGELLGYVLGNSQRYLRVVVPQDDIDAMRIESDRVLARLIDLPDVLAEGRIVRQVPAGETSLPSRALAMEGGGQIATDPRESKTPKALQRMFQFDIAIEGIPNLGTFGERAYVRFDHTMEPLGRRWYRAIRQLFLARFDG
jgi:putative peptide zinc metalloprotease protein